MGVMDRYNEKKKKKQEETTSSGVRERYEARKYYSSLPTDSVDEKYISSFISDSEIFLKSARDNYSSLGWSNASSSYESISNTWKDLNTKGDTIRGWLYKNRNSLGEETYNSVSKSLDSFNKDAQSIISSFQSALDEYSKFETEDAYNKYANIYKSGMEYASSPDAATGWEKYIADEEAKAQAAKEEQDNEKWYEKLGRYLSNNGTGVIDTTLPMANTTQVISDLRADDSYMKPQDDWSEEQKNAFGALYMLSPYAAFEFATYTNSLNAKNAEEEKIKKIQESATSSFGAGLGHALGAIATAPMGLADFLSDLTMASAGREIGPDGHISPFEYSQAVTSGITSDLNYNYGTLDDRIPLIGGKGLGDLYGWGASTAQSVASVYTLGPAGMLVSYFGQGAASGFDEKLSQGWSEEAAMLYGTTVGLIEGVLEALGGERLLRLGSATGKSFVRQMAEHAAAEGLEGGLSSLGSKFAEDVIDRVYQDGFTTFDLLVQEYMANGMSKSESIWRAWGKITEEVVFDAMSEGLSGAVGGGVQTGKQNISANKQAKNLYGENAADLVSESLEINPNNKFAQKMQNRLEGGKNLSGGQINRLIAANETYMRSQDVSAIQNAAKDRLITLGETGNVDAIARALTKQAQGKKLTLSEKQLIKNSKYGQRVANELNTDNIQSGEYSSAWAEKIGTNRINAEEYSRALADAEVSTDTNVEDKAPEVMQTSETTKVTEIPSTVQQASPQQVKTAPVTENATVKENATEGKIEAPESVSESEEAESTVTLADAATKYGAQAQAMIHTYAEGQDVAKYDKAYEAAYNMGMSGVSVDYAKSSDSTAYLTESQRELAYEAGKAAADAAAKEQDAKNKAKVNGKTGRRKGIVKGEGVTISDLKASFNDTQNKAYKILSTYAEATGVDIVLYKSEADADGNFIGSQGKFKWSDDTIYIDINAGLANIKDVNDLAKYAMIRTFSHEFTHFIEKWNPIWYNEFRKVVFDTLTERGENVNDLIETKMSMTEGMTYDKASREVVAEAMTDILPDANFVETLATKHKTIFDKLLEKLKEFLADLKAYFNTIGHNRSREANALKDQVEGAVHYVDNIVKLFDKVAVEAVENYQATVATEEETVSETENVAPTVDKTVTETINEVDEKGEGDAFTITDNAEFGTLEIKFDGKPSETIRNVLKENKFRWHKVKGVWYGKGERADIVKALQEAYKSQNNIGEGDIVNGSEQAEEKLITHGGAESGTLEGESGTRAENEDRSRVQGEDGKVSQDVGGALTSDRRVNKLKPKNSEINVDLSDTLEIDKDHILYEHQQKLINEYGIECYIIKNRSWHREAPAGAYKGIVYMSESFSGKLLATVVPHEATHVMKQLNYQPYLDLIDKLPDMLDMSSEHTEVVFNWIAEHCGFDFLSMSRAEGMHFYDEMNAAIYGFYKSGMFESEGLAEHVPNAFYDFDSYIAELDAIHEQYKKEHGVKAKVENAETLEAVSEEEITTEASEKAELSDEDIDKQYKNIYRWLKKASKIYEFRDNGHKYISDSYVFLKISDAIEAKINNDFLGLVSIQSLPIAITEAMNKATTLLTEPPLEGKTAFDAVYIFNLDGKTDHLFKKKYLSMLDGHSLYIGDFAGKKNGLIKAVDADGNIVGGVLGMELRGGHITDTKPSKLKSFSKKTITKEVNQNGENADNKRPILESDTDGERASRLLDESQTEDVQGTSSERKPVEDTRQRESEVGRVGDRTDAADRLGRSEGDSERGDLQLTEEEKSAREYASEKGYRVEINKLALKKGLTQVDIYDKNGLPIFNPIIINNASDWNKVKEAISNHEEREKIKAEELAETVEHEIEQKSTERPKGSNFVIGDSLNLPNGEKARFRANVDAIRLIKQLEAEGRFATAAEQEILSKYVGWGGLSNAFGELVWNRETRRSEMTPKDDWKNEFAELRGLVDEGIITEQEYKTMSASTKNAHYTSVEVIKAMYDGLAGLGFNGGRMLEPSSGVGNFVGAMPAEMTAKVNSWTMVELDRITGLIAKYLYPNSDVRIQGFENANIPDNYMDVAIGNVPFGDFGVVDRTYPKRITKSIHNYFFAKSIDKVRPGGIVMFITSSFTMNGKDTTVRQYIMERADLLGAIRLPNTAFKGNAGTDVVTDILILKKRESGTEYAGEDFLVADWDNDYGAYTSNYFKNHPEMVLGKPVTKRGMYGASTLTFEPFTDRGTIDDQIREAFKNIKGKMDYPTKPSPEKTNFAVEKATKKAKSGGFVVNSDGSISRNENGQLVKYDTDEKTAKRIAGMLSIRDAYKTLVNYLQQGQDAKYIKQARAALNEAYDTFVKEFGYINTPANRKAISSDPDSYSILSLENYDAQKKTAKKADIFTKDTISANKTITHVDSVEEGVIASINLTGGVDTALIAKLTGKTVEDVTRDIIDSRLAFKTRDNGLVARETYLSGNVRAKLREAEALAPYDKDFNNNIEELRKVIPADIPYNEIYITPGNAFIPNEVYADFIAYMLGGRNNQSYGSPDVEVGRTASGDFKIIINNKRLKNNYYNTQTWGTARKSFLDLIDAMMGSRTVKVTDTVETSDGRKISVINEAETEAANEKVKAIQKEFEDWIWKDEDRRNALARLYNETFNAIVNPEYDGSHLSVNGINADYSLRPHQANAVHRIISSGGNTLLAHRVGAGKTLEMAAAAMKLRELGVIKKPLFVVPKNVVAQWGVEFHNYFPAARLLVADDKSFTPANRKIFINQIANGDYDAVIVSYEQFEKIPMSVEYQQRFYEEQIDEIIAAIAEEKAESRDGKGLTVKEMEKKKAQLEKRLKELTSKPKDEDNIDFEMLGIDSLFVDEAHNFKNLEYVSKMTNVAGLGPSRGAQRAFDLYTKVRYLQGLNGGRGIVFATATPVMNSMVELYIMQRYLQPDVLNQLNLKSFDAWAKQFGEVVNKWEINPSGTGMRQKQVFANFRNLNELQLLFRSFADVLTEVPGLKIPRMKGGAVKIVECEPGEFQRNYMLELQKRAEGVKNVDPTEDNMLKITSDGRKVSYTQRMIDPTLPYEPECKIFKAAENILKEYKDSADIKGTQIVFLDMATPKGTDKSKTETNNEDSVDDGYDEENARLYEDLRDYLVKKGIPRSEIAFIHEANTDAKKAQLFEDVNNGKVRVLIGSTGKMGVGMNAQKRVVAIHHLDAPWRPGDVEQRDGRAFRQKNINEEVSKYVYVTIGSFDSRLWDILDRKQHFINQIMNGDDVGRTAEDTGEVTLSAAEVKALASGNPLIEEQTKLIDAIKTLENLLKAYNSSIVLAKTKLSDDEIKLANYTSRIARIREDIAARVDTYSDDKFSITVGKQTFTDKKDAGVALAAEIVARAKAESYVTVGKFAGFDLKVIKNGSEYSGLIQGKESYKFNVYLNNTTRMVNHIGEIIAGFENMIKNTEQMISETTADRDAQKNIIAQPFEKQDELERKRARFNEVMELLAPKTEEQRSKMDNDTVQEQSREYLDEQHQQRTDTLTDREVLELAANEVKVSDLTQAETDALTIFRDRLSELKDLQEERAEQGRLYKEQQFGENVDRKAAEETLNRMHILDSQIKKATAEVLTVEEKEVLKRVLSKARKVVEAQEREHGKEILNRWRDRRNNAAAIKKYRDRLRGDVDELSNWILHPNNTDIVKHVPDVLKNSVIPFLSSINFMSKRALNGGAATKADVAFMDNLRKLNSALKINIDINGLYSGYSDLPPNFMENLQRFIDSTEALVKKNSGVLVINQMTSAELKELSQIVRTLKKYIMKVNSFHYNAMYEHVYEAGENSIEYLTDLGNAGSTGAVSNFLLWQQIRPAYAFERFGKGGEAIYDGLRRGQAKLAFNTKEIQSFTEKAYTEKEVKAWEDEIKTFRLGRDLVKMPVSYIMAFYELSKDPEALQHINGEGIRVATYTHKGKKISDTGHILTVGEFNQIIGSLTDRQKEVADALQKYMAEQGGKWGNYVSVARFGEELFTNPKYFPINSDGRHLQANMDEHPSAAALYALLNMSFTKSRKEGANNRIVIYSIFDVFANHMASMAQYNAMALPILDALKWFNYQQVFFDDEGNKQKGESVRERMDRAYGVPEETKPGRGKSGYAQDFVMNIIKAFNGTEAQGTPYDSFGLKPLHLYNIAQVAYNLRVVVQQPMSITRAAMLLDYGSILKGMKLKPSAIKQNIEEMEKYSGIAAWKSLGFYDVNISRGLTHLIKHDSTVMDKIADVGMWGAEKADTLTWAAIWNACKEEVRKKEHLTPESKGFYEAVTKLFEDVIYKTQVVDSILTKNEFMRDKGAFARLVGSFMSESTTNASMLIDAYDKYQLDMQRGMTRQQAWKKNSKMIGRRLYVYAVGAILLAAVQAAADALRDDDDYEEWYEKWLEEFGGNLVDELMPFNKLPILSDFYDLAKELLSIFGVDTYGNPPQSVFMQWYDSLIKGTEIIYQKITGEDTDYTYYGGIFKLLQAVSGMTGLPMASATREIITAWNNTIGAMAPSLKVKDYEPSELSQIKYAYEDGYLTAEEATAQILEKGLADTEDEAYFIIQGWKAGDGYSRYDKVYDAVRNGASIDEAMAELTSHGYAEEDVLSQVKSEVGKWYRGGEISKQQTVNMLTKYFDMESNEITGTIAYWEYKRDNPDAEVNVDMFEKYYSDVASSGISINTYIDYRNKVKDITGEDKKARRMTVINSLPITNAQKDALYYAEGWAASKLYEAPWH